jgi:hypothetical protein
MTSWCRCPGTPRQRQEQHRSLTVTYTYDALGHRVSERKLEAPGAMLSKSFLHDGEHVAAEAQTNASDALAEPRRYTRTELRRRSGGDHAFGRRRCRLANG